MIKKEVPRGTETNVVVAVVVPVVDIDAAIVTVTDVDTVAVRGKLLASICVTEDLGLLPDGFISYLS